MVKSLHAFKNIGEVAEELNLPQHVLRFWETKFTLIKPVKRGGGRRYYRPEDVDNLRRIQCLLYDDGYTIKGVQKLFKEGGKSSSKKINADLRENRTSKVNKETNLKLQSILSELEEISTYLKS